ncbi:PREDICTED: uncharacterized protein LOC108566738 [Nicrophorus vespilloides]|uniref:Uncharacterized protein LOC108566738 n=1 Tax=Nicrophorus vespilloides TaxID=110193 RepID=A0ABM1N5Z9_NICVS|nr:PREDICTED: uncharacterized protein LOC108566738 [Nicrophorus vespilloides]
MLLISRLCIATAMLWTATAVAKGVGTEGDGRMYFAIAVPYGETGFGRAFNKTLANITQSLVTVRTSAGNYSIALDTLVIELPQNGSFTAVLLETLCQKFEGKHVVAVLILGHSPAAFTVSLAATYSGIPVLWARGQGGFLTGFSGIDSHVLEMHLAPTGREVVQALRGILLQAHWHTFTILADSTSSSALQRPDLWGPLAVAPLHPTLIPLPNPPAAQQIFRKLADISRSTRGVVVLLTNREVAVRILEDARRLNMLDGHFVWIWIDTRSSSGYGNSSENNGGSRRRGDGEPGGGGGGASRDGNRGKRRVDPLEELGDMHVNYLLKNDQFLLFNREPQKRQAGSGGGGTVDAVVRTRKRSRGRPELPLGLLSLRPVPIKIDRHLVKGAVRLLISALKVALARGPHWLMDNLVLRRLTTSCWRPQGNKERNFSELYGT